ncbi:NAD(P)-dependent oxidoreductase [Vibrio sp.]|uniref:precorrin-2 dehydrogenase/sirohydrochlorin ferrochelatase family protein n=1 Tax=Vibrio sp. TaxID=678 RepID=UPI003D0DCE15
MQYFPLFFDLHNKPVLVVGGGEVACRKVEALIRAGANVTVVSPKIEKYLKQQVREQKCQWVQNFYSSELIESHFVQVWATTDNPELNHRVHADAKKRGIMVNVVDDLPYCDFITPSMVNRGRIQIAISSGGGSPVLVRKLREKIESVLPQNLALIAEFSASKRNSIKETLPSVDLRRKFWQRFFSSPEVNSATDRKQLESTYRNSLSEGFEEQGSCCWIEFGEDVEMLSLKALQQMQQAELVLHHSSTPFEFIDLCRRDAERQPYKSAEQLADVLTKAKADKKSICVFVPKERSSYQLLIGNLPVYLPARQG